MCGSPGWASSPMRADRASSGLASNGTLLSGDLAAAIGAKLAPLGIPHETREFRPHITLARFKSQEGLEGLSTAVAEFSHTEFARATADKFHLYRSVLKPSGAEYTRLETYFFAGEQAVLNFQLAPPLSSTWWLPLVAYLIGSIPFGYLIVLIAGGGDIRHRGSGNIGATNVAREAGAISGVLTLLLDAAKGYLAVWLAGRITGGNVRWMTLAALLALVGHMFPVWLGFQGGRGVATGAGVFFPICWQAVVGALIIWIRVVAFWRYASLGSISAASSLPLLMYLLYAPGTRLQSRFRLECRRRSCWLFCATGPTSFG